MYKELTEKKVLLVTSNLGLTFQIVRILNKMGIKPFVLGPDSKLADGRSFLYIDGLFCQKYIAYDRDEMGYDYSLTISSFSKPFIHKLNVTCEQYQIDVILPIDYTAVLPLTTYHDYLRRHLKLVPYILEPTLRYINNKWEFTQFCQSLHIPTPKSVLIEHVIQVSDLDLSFPVIIKPLNSGGGRGVKRLESVEAVRQHIVGQHIQLLTAPLICQEFIQGKELEVFVYAIKGELKAWSMCYVEGGIGQRRFVEDPVALQHCRLLLKSLKYDGPGLLDIIYDTERARYNFLEINIRFPGSTMYHYLAGVNHVELALRFGLGMDTSGFFHKAKQGYISKPLYDALLLKVNSLIIRMRQYKARILGRR